ncbi:MAG: chloride channel protein [Thermus sp.]|uniref:chloride channel protein n=1 Tax=Thermus sp. TaxID=275 RepID=UPI0025E6A98E|nr:chloride channel protein [Thermus sp.]MCS6868096.1 chloride channel protein [Thermus sp.]MDW8017971.1 chloride channel protein [Thermus sp.]MDW8357347.1 chloride channel protein [Thermus sp.]
MRPPGRTSPLILPPFWDEEVRRTGPLILYSAFTGALAGLLVALLNALLQRLTQTLGLLFGYLVPEPPGEGGLAQAFTGPRPWALALALPFLFALTSFLGTGRGLAALLRHAREGEPSPHLAYPRAVLGGTLQLSLYSPMGREGPFGVLGLWLGSALDRRFPRLGGGLAFAGLAAGLAASLHAPVAGALLATEILYRGLLLEVRALTPALIGALSGFAVYGALYGYTPLLPFPVAVGLEAIPSGLLLGLLAAGLSSLWLEGSRLVRGWLQPLAFPWRHALLGLALALALLLLPEALGTGLGWVGVATTPLLAPGAALALLLAKVALLVLALGVRAYGGPFTPALVLGGLLGAWLAKLSPGGPWTLTPEAAALAGGAALLAATARAPFAATVLAAEWGGYAALPLVLPAVLLAYALTPAHDPEEGLRKEREGPVETPSERPPQSEPLLPGPEADAGRETPPG